ncbi:MAG: phage terminase small subunit P27 family [Rhodospirillaceae bacterium]
MKGRKPNPDRLPMIALAEGKDVTSSDPTSMAERALVVAEPFCPEPVTECPDALDCWNRLVPELVRAGLVTPIFEGMLAAYCTVFARWVEAERELRKTAKLVKSPTGYPLQNPWLAIANRAIEQMRQLSGELGLSAAALTRVSRAAQRDLFEDDPDEGQGNA